LVNVILNGAQSLALSAAEEEAKNLFIVLENAGVFAEFTLECGEGLRMKRRILVVS
jgi:hypothetical protein